MVGTGFDTKMLRSLHGKLTGLERSLPAFGKGHLPGRRGARDALMTGS
jgi:hypothetical protein